MLGTVWRPSADDREGEDCGATVGELAVAMGEAPDAYSAQHRHTRLALTGLPIQPYDLRRIEVAIREA